MNNNFIMCRGDSLDISFINVFTINFLLFLFIINLNYLNIVRKLLKNVFTKN